MKKLKIYIVIALMLPVFIITGCELGGLDLQESYDYDDQAGLVSNELNKSVWEFLNSRPDAFRLMVEGIEYAGLTDMYNEPNTTYMALTDNAIMVYFANNRLLDSVTKLPTYFAASLTQYPQEQVRELLLYHIVKGSYSWHNLPPVQTWYDSYASADSAKVNLYLAKNDRSPAVTFNNFPSHYVANLKARSSNLKANNGSFVHVMDSYLRYPTWNDLSGN